VREEAGWKGPTSRGNSGATSARGIWPVCCESDQVKGAHTMIAATAFAVVGLVVVAFLNRIP
jgi:hypothetical protein